MSIEENKALVRRSIEEVWNNKNLSVIDEIYTASYVGHDPASPTGQISGPEGARQFVGTYLQAFPDAHVTLEDLVAEGDKVVGRYTARGTHQGELMGIAPTGKQATVTGIGISRCAGGKIVEDWNNFDALGMMQQLGVIPTPEEART